MPAVKRSKRLNASSLMWNESDPVSGIRAFDDPDRFVGLGLLGVALRPQHAIATVPLPSNFDREAISRPRLLLRGRKMDLPNNASRDRDEV